MKTLPIAKLLLTLAWTTLFVLLVPLANRLTPLQAQLDGQSSMATELARIAIGCACLYCLYACLSRLDISR